MKCQECNGEGWLRMAPKGVNPFNVRLPTLAYMMREVRCWSCRGTGEQRDSKKT